MGIQSIDIYNSYNLLYFNNLIHKPYHQNHIQQTIFPAVHFYNHKYLHT